MMPNSRPNLIAISRAYLGLLTKTHGIRIFAIFCLSLVLGLVNGVGVLMLVPLLEVAGVPGSASGSPGRIAALFSGLGIAPSIESILVAVALLVGGHALLLRWTNIAKSKLELSFAKSLQDRLYTAIAHAGWSFYSRRRSSDFTHALTSNLDRVSTATFYFFRLLSGGLMALVHTGVAAVLSPSMTAICGVCAVVMGFVLRRQNRVATETGSQVTALSEKFYAEISDHLAGMREIKSLGVEQNRVVDFRDQTAQIATARLRFNMVRETTTCIYTTMSATLLVALLFIAIKLLQIQPAELIVLILVFARLAPRLRDLHLSYQQILNAMPAFQSAMQMQRQCDAARELMPAQAQQPWNLHEAIVFNNVSYRYGPESEGWALRCANVTIPAHTTTVIFGPSGAGKSTFADLLLGLMIPTEGTIAIDNEVLNRERLRDWRQNIGYVPQSTFLLHDTIRENLLWARPSSTDDELRAALRMAAADAFVDELPNGLETVVGDRGSRLSGGEAQRIALARALLRKPSILILDEATNALDIENRQRIESAIRRLHGQLTVIIVAHQLGAIEDADQIVVLDRGHVVQTGSFDDLAQQEGRFRTIIATDRASEEQANTDLPTLGSTFRKGVRHQ